MVINDEINRADVIVDYLVVLRKTLQHIQSLIKKIQQLLILVLYLISDEL